MEAQQEQQPKLSVKRAVAHIANKHKIRTALRNPTGFKFAIADGISMMSVTHWDTVTAGTSFFLSRPYLQMLEQHGPANITPRYALIFENDLPVAAVYLQIVTVAGDSIGSKIETADAGASRGLLKKLIEPAKKQLAGRVQQRFLVCGNMLTYGFHGVAFAPGRNPAELWPAVAEVLYRVRRADKLSGQADFVMVKDVPPTEATGVAVLANLSYRPVETEPNMVLEIPSDWKNYEGYLASLASKYRSSVRQQILKPIQAMGCTVERITGLDDYAESLHDLYLQVHDNATIRPFTLPLDYFGALEAAAGENLLCTVIRREERILGFIISLKDGETGFGYHIGFDREAGAELPLYLRLLHASVEDGISLDCRRLSLGRTALEPKARLGALPHPVAIWVRHRQPITNILVRNLVGIIKHEEAPERSPFKKPA